MKKVFIIIFALAALQVSAQEKVKTKPAKTEKAPGKAKATSVKVKKPQTV